MGSCHASVLSFFVPGEKKKLAAGEAERRKPVFIQSAFVEGKGFTGRLVNAEQLLRKWVFPS